MEYASLTFIFIFLPQVLCFYYLLSLIKSKVLSGKLQNILLFSAGLVFYAFAAGFSGLAFIIVYLSANHMLGLLIEKCENRKPVFILSVLINVLALLFFKYNGMVLDIVSDLVSGQVSGCTLFFSGTIPEAREVSCCRLLFLLLFFNAYHTLRMYTAARYMRSETISVFCSSCCCSLKQLKAP